MAEAQYNINQGANVTDVILFLFGAVGAAAYAFPMFRAARAAGEVDALWAFLFSLGLGGIVTVVSVPALGHWQPWTVKPDPRLTALIVGLFVNPLIPPLLKSLIPPLVEWITGIVVAIAGGKK